MKSHVPVNVMLRLESGPVVECSVPFVVSAFHTPVQVPGAAHMYATAASASSTEMIASLLALLSTARRSKGTAPRGKVSCTVEARPTCAKRTRTKRIKRAIGEDECEAELALVATASMAGLCKESSKEGGQEAHAVRSATGPADVRLIGLSALFKFKTSRRLADAGRPIMHV